VVGALRTAHPLSLSGAAAGPHAPVATLQMLPGAQSSVLRQLDTHAPNAGSHA
jgi:hypothetical protein